MVKKYHKYFFIALFSLIIFSHGKSQKLIPFAQITNTYTGEVNQNVTVNKFICDSLGNLFLLLKVQGKISVNATDVPDLLNDKTKAPSYQVIKINKVGEYQWGLSSSNPIADIACDSSGSLFFCANDQSDFKNSRMVFYQSKTILMTENSNNILVKFSPDGEYIWSKKMQGEFYSPRSILKISYDNKLYCLITKNGTRMMDHSVICMDLNGREEWRTDIFNQYIDVFEPAPDGKSYIAGYDYKVDDKKIVVYPFEISRYVLLELDETGNPKKILDKKFDFNTEVKARSDFYMNGISFDTSNNPLFVYANLISSETPEITVANRKYRKATGEFVFVLLDKKGEIISDYQLKTGTNTSDKQRSPEGSMGLVRNIGLRFTKNCSWLVCLPTAAPIVYGEKRYELLNKIDLIYLDLDLQSKTKINWISTAATGKLITPTPFIQPINDSTFFVNNQSNKPKDNVQGTYADLRKLEIKIKKKPKVVETIIETDTDTTSIEESNLIDSTEVDSAAIKKAIEDSTSVAENSEINIESNETIADSSSNTENNETENTEIENSSTENTETVTDTSSQEKESTNELKIQLLPLQNGQTMVLYINKVPDDTLKSSRMTEVEIRDENGNNIFPREMELEGNKLQFTIEIGQWKRGIYKLAVTVAGKETAEMKIVKI